jgi:hypothetical protein
MNISDPALSGIEPSRLSLLAPQGLGRCRPVEISPSQETPYHRRGMPNQTHLAQVARFVHGAGPRFPFEILLAEAACVATPSGLRVYFQTPLAQACPARATAPWVDFGWSSCLSCAVFLALVPDLDLDLEPAALALALGGADLNIEKAYATHRLCLAAPVGEHGQSRCACGEEYQTERDRCLVDVVDSPWLCYGVKC